ncbi:DegT/DnrJ/EryC1/StrS family aminotransferase [Flavobacterium gilvum]|uniref:Aminotransferase n=1 Tax=Flavobacterium gilvum TaxID=1492737 RepID=A0AAC9I4M5_9FLAO|nr:DegT/DnrJ/EryC1/StrS family aminotransferase [Flavobacterium gilvum]AOW09570.1 aminotransferase [Flavobacterium gilvum]KFC58989.1 aminotransferase [Flavobacterium gilvum]
MIKFLDLKKINEPYETAFQQKLKTVLDSGWYILGKEVQEFETRFANYCGAKYCIGVGNGLDALTLIFSGYVELGKLQKGDEVIVPANTYIASILAILQAGLAPVLVEPKLETYTIDPNLISEKITPKTKAILAVNLYGQLAEMDAIHEIAKQNNLIVVEDAAQSTGAIKNQKSAIKNLKSSVAYSFYPTKNLGALGDGGAVVTDDELLFKVIRSLRNYGSEIKYQNDFVGVNSRLDELQAAFLNLKLPNLDADNQKRKAIAKRYLSEIKNDKIILPFWDLSHNHVFHLFVIRTENRDDLQNYLLENQIQTVIHYPIPPHKQKALKSWNNLSFPLTEKIHNEVLSLPISPVMTDNEVTYVISILNKY